MTIRIPKSDLILQAFLLGNTFSYSIIYYPNLHTYHRSLEELLTSDV